MTSSMKPPSKITLEEIVKELGIYHPGFTSGECDKCKKTANFAAGEMGFICTCGHFNVGSRSGAFTPHEMPNLGPSRETIKLAIIEYRKRARRETNGKIY